MKYRGRVVPLGSVLLGSVYAMDYRTIYALDIQGEYPLGVLLECMGCTGSEIPTLNNVACMGRVIFAVCTERDHRRYVIAAVRASVHDSLDRVILHAKTLTG